MHLATITHRRVSSVRLLNRRSPELLQSRSPRVYAAAGLAMSTEWSQATVTLGARQRGCHVVTQDIYKQVPQIREYDIGLANIFLLHTSASLTVNENASPDVPLDLADALDRLAPEGSKQKYRHDDEGPDDMPAHIKSSLMGPSLTIPIVKGRLGLGTWQGIYLNEHRDYGGSRRVIVTLQGQKREDGRQYSSFD